MPRYSPTLLDHFHQPRNFRRWPAVNAEGTASLGGRAPRIKMLLEVDQQHIHNAGCSAFGCGVAIACASVLTELAQDKTLRQAARIRAEDIVSALQSVPADKRFCADVAIEALQDAISNYNALNSEKSGDDTLDQG